MTLAAHGFVLDLLPRVGGAIGSLSWQGHDILRATPAKASNPLATACFPLVPYANRIANGRFTFDGAEHQLARNFGDHPHSLHGEGWLREWTVEDETPHSVTLFHAGGSNVHWPWGYEARQTFTLAERRFTLGVEMRNLADKPVPAGLGLHPYFPMDDDTRLTAQASGVWLAEGSMLPTECVDADHFGRWAQGDRVAGEGLVDNAYQGWNGHARIVTGGLDLRLSAAGASGFHLYRPAEEAFFCFEPVSHLPDAINRGGMPLLAPGATARLTLEIAVDLYA